MSESTTRAAEQFRNRHGLDDPPSIDEQEKQAAKIEKEGADHAIETPDHNTAAGPLDVNDEAEEQKTAPEPKKAPAKKAAKKSTAKKTAAKKSTAKKK